MKIEGPNVAAGAKERRNLNRVGLISLLAALISPVSAAQDQGQTSTLERAPEMRLAAETVTLPIVMVREFPFVEGEIGGVKGKFLLDTGMQDALVINDHRVRLEGGTKIGTGFFGSGQTYDVRLHAGVDDIRIGNIRLPGVSAVRSQDARMLERITPDFIGWIGYDFFASHALEMDYRRSRATFYKEGTKRYLQGEKVIAVLPFETRKLPNHPLLPARIGDVEAILSLDTGMNGDLSIPEDKKLRLLAAGHLRATGDPDKFDVARVRIADKIDVTLPSIEIEEGPSPAAKSIGITEDTELSLGYVFLRQYKTVWDFRQKRLYLLAR